MSESEAVSVVRDIPVNFDRFVLQIRGLLSGTADGKGYSSTGPDGENQLYQFVQKHVSGSPHSHALGEIIYKAVRFAHKGNKDDIAKIAAWAFLILKHDGAK